MDHWDRALPGFVLRVEYEDVVDDLETQVQRILDFCELPFEKWLDPQKETLGPELLI